MNINQIPSPQVTFKNFSPATGIAPGSRRLAGWTLPLTIWYFIEGRPQTEQVEGFITLVTQDQLVILTCKDRRTQHCWQHNRTSTAAQHLSLSFKHLYLCPCVSGECMPCVFALVKPQRTLDGLELEFRTAASICEGRATTPAPFSFLQDKFRCVPHIGLEFG